uniref:Uncharacterized protein n=1 Tax=Palpitomonas bilix TaxID=652834 RepID=A0A7S3D4V5_9EUKA|mmetsp:Transcript_222/g.275  ORF Transcript_222/g.275 Transcript_222/m.275 type:complete len:160 (+) Transcript_222:268-747(+)
MRIKEGEHRIGSERRYKIIIQRKGSGELTLKYLTFVYVIFTCCRLLLTPFLARIISCPLIFVSSCIESFLERLFLYSFCVCYLCFCFAADCYLPLPSPFYPLSPLFRLYSPSPLLPSIHTRVCGHTLLPFFACYIFVTATNNVILHLHFYLVYVHAMFA